MPEIKAFFVVREFAEGGEEILAGPFWTHDQARYSEVYAKEGHDYSRWSHVTIKEGLLPVTWV